MRQSFCQNKYKNQICLQMLSSASLCLASLCLVSCFNRKNHPPAGTFVDYTPQVISNPELRRETLLNTPAMNATACLIPLVIKIQIVEHVDLKLNTVRRLRLSVVAYRQNWNAYVTNDGRAIPQPTGTMLGDARI